MTNRLASLSSELNVDPWTRNRDFYAAIGAVFSPVFIPVGNAAPTSQTIYGVATYLYAGETVTNILNAVVTPGAGTAPSAIKLGLWSSAATPVCLEVTADLASDSKWTAAGGGWKVNALSTPYPVTSNGLYYLAYWQNGTFGTTNMTLITGHPNSALASAIGSNPGMARTLKTSATSMAAADTGTYGAVAAVTLMAWS